MHGSKEAKSPFKNLVRQRCAEGFNPGVKGLNLLVHHVTSRLQKLKYNSKHNKFTYTQSSSHEGIEVRVGVLLH
jgi:hypothetical protein